MTSGQYKSILTNNITKTYQKAEQSTQLNINREAKTRAEVCKLVGLYLLGKLAPLIGTKKHWAL